jgi:hypothetical protein
MKEQTFTVFRRHGLHDLASVPYLKADLSDRAFDDVSRSRVMMARAAAAQDDGASEAVDHTEAFLNDPSLIINSRGTLAQRILVPNAGAGA